MNQLPANPLYIEDDDFTSYLMECIPWSADSNIDFDNYKLLDGIDFGLEEPLDVEQQPVTPQYVEQHVTPQYVEQPVTPQYVEQPVIPQYVEQPVTPQYVEQQPVTPQYVEQQPVTPQYVEQPVTPQYVEQPVTPQYVEQQPVTLQYVVEQTITPQYVEQPVTLQYVEQPVTLEFLVQQAVSPQFLVQPETKYTSDVNQVTTNVMEQQPGAMIQFQVKDQVTPKKRGRKPKHASGAVRKPRRQRKIKVYEMVGPFKDIKEERKRLAAVNAKKHREEAKKNMAEKENLLAEVQAEVNMLKQKVKKMQQNEKLLRQQLAQQQQCGAFLKNGQAFSFGLN